MRLLAALALLALSGCVTKVATGPNGLPVGPAVTTYEGPGAPVGGVALTPRVTPVPDGFQISLPQSAPAPAVPPPANLTAP